MSVERFSTLEQQPVAVIGGGLAGLTAAADLAKAGRSVTLFESASAVGGRATTHDLAGFRFNLGPRALYVQGAGKAILDDLGVEYRGHRPPLTNGSALINDSVAPLPMGLWSLMTCPWMTVRERFEVTGFLARLPKLNPETLRGQSAAQWLGARLACPASRGLVEALLQLTTYCADHEHLCAEAAAHQMKIGLMGSVLYIDGGWQTLVGGLREVAVRAGAIIKTGSKVERVESFSDRAVCVVAGGERVPVSGAVLAVGPRRACRLLAGKYPEVDRRAERCRPVFAACLDIALRDLPRPDRLFAQGIDRPFYLSVHSASADLAPEGSALIHVLCYLRSDEALTRDQARQELEGALDRMQPGWRELVVERRLLPKMLVSHDVPSVNGARIDGRVSDRIHLAGDWVGDQGLLADAAIASGRRAARSMLESRSAIRDPRRVA